MGLWCPSDYITPSLFWSYNAHLCNASISNNSLMVNMKLKKTQLLLLIFHIPVFLTFKPQPKLLSSVHDFLQKSMEASPLVLINLAVLLFLRDSPTSTVSRAFWNTKVPLSNVYSLPTVISWATGSGKLWYTIAPTQTSLEYLKLKISPSQLFTTFLTYLNLLLFWVPNQETRTITHPHHPGRNMRVSVDQRPPPLHHHSGIQLFVSFSYVK